MFKGLRVYVKFAYIILYRKCLFTAEKIKNQFRLTETGIFPSPLISEPRGFLKNEKILLRILRNSFFVISQHYVPKNELRHFEIKTSHN